MALAAVTKCFFEIVALDVHDDAVGKGEGILGEGGYQSLFLVDAAGDKGSHFGIFRFHRGNPSI